jgi:ribosomal RNA-processing protein 8
MDLKQKLKKELERKSQFKKVQKHTAVGSSLNGPKLSRPALSRTNTLEKKLSGAEFRFINQKLYTCTSKEAVKLFKTSPELFDVYHKGFRLQCESWSANPNDSFLEYLKSKPEELVIADMGCGEGFLAKSLPQRTIHSFDLVAANEFVVACDIAHVPLDDKSVDIVIFSLSLMGTNFAAFILEARRILKRGYSNIT